MAQPEWTGLEAPELKGHTLDIGRGDWQQGPGAEPLINPKWLAYVTVDGQPVYGDVPRMPSVAASVAYNGELPWSERLRLDLARYADGRPHAVIVYRYAASYFDGWGDHPEDAWEWGHYSASNQSTPARTPFSFTLAPAAPPPPPRGTADVAGAITAIDEAVRELESSAGYRLTRLRNPRRFAETAMGRARGKLDVALYRLRPP